MDLNIILYLAPAIGAAALCIAFVLASGIGKIDAGTDRMKEIASYIHEGAMAFLKSQYKIIAVFVAVVFIAVSLSLGWETGICFVLGAVFSVLAGFIGMQVATKANVRTANEAKKGIPGALKVAFRGGAVMGLCVVGLGIIGIAATYLFFGGKPEIITGFGLGASSIALFGRVGGGIYTKAADVGADLVGKVEAGIPEDDPRNPAVIADNVGDNVGDVAGMGSDLFESYVGSIISAVTLGTVLVEKAGLSYVLFPLALASVGILASILGTMFVRGKEGKDPSKALNLGTYASGVLVIIAAFVMSNYFLGNLYYFCSIIAGLISGIAIGKVTEIYTSSDYSSVKKIAKQSETGPATTVIAGLSVGMLSTVVPTLLVCAAIFIAYYFGELAMASLGLGTEGGLYGIALAAVGMLSTSGMTIAVDAYGPIADNAGGIAEMAELDPEVREVTDKLDAVGNTTAAIGKGFAISSAALTALALFASYSTAAKITAAEMSVMLPQVIIGMFIGGVLPFFFSALTMDAVGKAAYKMIDEVRRQFREMPGIMEGTTKPDYTACVSISTNAALKEMILPGLSAIIVPVAVGFLLGKGALAGVLAGSVVTGVLMAIMMSNAGGAWDNAKKYIESGAHGGKGGDTHKAAVVGDTVGDPFKDTSGPSMNTLICMMTIVSVVFLPLFLR